MRLPRMTARRWMIAVAVVGLPTGVIIAGYRQAERRDLLLYRARCHTEMARSYESSRPGVIAHLGCPKAIYQRAELRHLLEILPRRIAYHEAMARKYQDAALHPWRPVEPDPPEPQ
jgi:hypothetical protein